MARQAFAHVAAVRWAETSRVKNAKRMRNLLLSTLVCALAANAMACNCFSPEIRAKTGRETLELAQAAVFGRIVEVKADGSAELIVLESFKGPQQGATMLIAPGADRCRSNLGKPGEKVLVIVFQEPATLCETYDQDHFLLEAFRANLKK